MRKFLSLVVVVLTILTGCTTTKVSRISEDKKIDLSGNWNDTDITIVSNDMIDDCLHGKWLKLDTVGKKPVVVIGEIENRSSEHIDTTIVGKKLESALVGSGKVVTVNDFEKRGTLEAERAYQAKNASAATAKASGNETGADYILLGSVSTNIDQQGKQSVRTYYVDLELVDIASGEKVWMNEKTIKKFIQKDHFKF